MPVLKTMDGDIHYTTYPLYVGIKKIDKAIARENLLLLKSIVDEQQISFGLIGGTLLGAVREHDFIEHDEDIDLFFLEEDKQRFFAILPSLIEQGFMIARYDRRGLISIMRKGEYIDLYFFATYDKSIRICSGWCMPEKFLIDTVLLDFQGSAFMVPKDYLSYLKYEYGESWRTPIPYTDFKLSTWKILSFKIKEKMKDFLPNWVYFFAIRKVEERMKEHYLQKIDQYLD